MTANGISIHEKAQELVNFKMEPFVRLADGALLAVDQTNSACISRDEGVSWETHPLFQANQDMKVSRERALIRTREGAIILAFINLQERVWTWDPATSNVSPDNRLPTYVIRSLDGGKTWQDLQKLHDEWTGAVRDMIQTREGRIVFTSMMMLANPGRHTVVTYSSSDEGETWKRSNIIDLGGNGHHGGATEGTLEELGDGRLRMLVRTNLSKFWNAFSADGGIYWRTLLPSDIASSSAPGLLKRLKSGRLVLVWNRPYPEGETSYPLTGGDNQWSETPVSNHRAELSMAFSEDDGETWKGPVVIAGKATAVIAYPYVFEASPGELWTTTMQGGLRIKLFEKDFVGDGAE